MRALIDLDPMKYAVGFACQHSVFKGDDGTDYTVKQVKGGMKALRLHDNAILELPGFRTKQAVLDELGGEFNEEIRVEPDQHVLFTVKRMLWHVLDTLGCKEYTGYLSRGDCFRVGVYPEYKANRKDIAKPLAIPVIEEYLLKNHPTVVCEQIEADDELGIQQSQALKRGEQTIICSPDKDLDMIPGWHYNYQSKKLYEVTPEQGLHSFWCQMLTGDSTDNIPGLPGVGPAKADLALLHCGPGEYKDTVLGVYDSYGWGEEEFERNGILLWMLRKPLEETYGMTYEEFFR